MAEKDNVLLTLCCSKNSYNQENGEGGGGVYLQGLPRSALLVGTLGPRRRLDRRLEAGG